MLSSPENVTQLLAECSRGDRAALDRLLPLVYDELRRLADSYMRRERADHTLQPTALVHEAYLRLVAQDGANWQNRAHFFGIAARLMRQILINHAEAHDAQKRGGGAHKLALDEAVSFFEQQDLNLLALDEALTRLAAFDPQQARIVELRFFGGLTIEEIAEVTGVSPSTVKREWSVAKTWLYKVVMNDE